MSSSERLEINAIQARVSGAPEFQEGRSAEENGRAMLTAVSAERNRIDNGRALSQLGLHNFSVVETNEPSHESTLTSALTQQTEPDDGGPARDRRLNEGRLNNPAAAQFFEDKAIDLAFSKGGNLGDSVELDRAIQEILHNKWCMGAHDTSAEDIKKDWDILKKAGVSENDINKIIEQAEAKHIPGGRSCLIG